MKLMRGFGLIVALVASLLIVAGFSAPALAGTTGSVSGTVTSASGAAIAGAEVVLVGTTVHATADDKGYYYMQAVPPGTYTVRATCDGYKPSEVADVSVVMDVAEAIDLTLEDAAVQETEVVVTETKAKPTVQHDVVPTMYTVDARQEPIIRSQPNVMYQAPSILATLPGVVMDAGGYAHIRGGRSNEIGYMIDGVPITEPVTNGFATNLVTVGLDKMEVFTGGYRAEYGNAISGVINQVTKTGLTSPGGKIEALGGSDSYQGVYPEFGGSNEKGFDYYVGAYLWESDFTGSDAEHVDSSDGVGKFNYTLDDSNKLTALVGSGAATYTFPWVHDQVYRPGNWERSAGDDSVKQDYDLFSLALTHTISPKSFVTVRPYVFNNTLRVDATSNDEAVRYAMDTKCDALGILADYSNQISRQHLLKAGLLRTASDNSYWYAMPDYEYEYSAPTDTTQTGIYLQDQMELSSKLRVDLGLRYDSMRYDREVKSDVTESQVSPRLGVSYAVSPKSNLRFSYGKMIQFADAHAMEQIFTLEDYAKNLLDSLSPQHCTQYDLGWEREVATDVTLQVTPFIREYRDMIQTRLSDMSDPYSPKQYANIGHASASGVEVYVRKRPSKSWSAWVSYTLMRARGEASDAGYVGSYRYLDWDQRHTLSAAVNYIRNGWTYSALAQYGSGLPYTLEEDISENSRRAPAHTVISVNAATAVKAKWIPEGKLQLSLYNVFNVCKPLQIDYDGSTAVSIPSRRVSLGYSRRF